MTANKVVTIDADLDPGRRYIHRRIAIQYVFRFRTVGFTIRAFIEDMIVWYGKSPERDLAKYKIWHSICLILKLTERLYPARYADYMQLIGEEGYTFEMFHQDFTEVLCIYTFSPSMETTSLIKMAAGQPIFESLIIYHDTESPGYISDKPILDL